MSDFSISDWPHWETLTPTFKGSFPAIKEEVYNAAGEIWPRALEYAYGRGLDESDAREVMLKAVASVSKIEPQGIKSLCNYLLTSYVRLVRKALSDRSRYASLDSINRELLSDPDAAAILEKNVLLAEIVARMDDETLRIYQGLVLGYSFEEMARSGAKPANILRSRFSKAVKRMAKELQSENS